MVRSPGYNPMIIISHGGNHQQDHEQWQTGTVAIKITTIGDRKITSDIAINRPSSNNQPMSAKVRPHKRKLLSLGSIALDVSQGDQAQ